MQQLDQPTQQPAPAPTAEQRSGFYIRLSPPTATRVLLVANVVMFLAVIAVGYFVFNTVDGTRDNRVLVFMGAKFNPAIADGQVWRLFTAMFLHIGVFHLLVNMYALNALGPLVEGYFGHRRFLAIYLLGGLLGSLASYAFSDAISAGASGAIFGLAGATTVYFLRYRDNFGKRGRAILQNMLFVIGINLVFGLSVPGIDNWGHMGGLVGGALLAWGLLPKYGKPEPTFSSLAAERASERTGELAERQALAEIPRTLPEIAVVAVFIAALIFVLQWVTNGYLAG